jgi:hypothetical protein
MDAANIINAVAAAGICACAGILMRISSELAGFREWRKHVDATLARHEEALEKK